MVETLSQSPDARGRWLSSGDKPALVGYAAAVAAFLLAWAVRAALDPWLANTQPFGTFYLAITFVAWWAGWRPATVTLVLSYATAHWFFMAPRHAFRLENTADVVEHVVYFFVALTIIVLLELHRRARQAAAQAVSQLKDDVLKREAAERALRQSEARFRAIFENAGLGIAEADADGRFLTANDRMCQILGRPRESIIGARFHDLTHLEDQAESDRLNAEVVSGRVPRMSYEKRYLRGDGSPVWVRVTASAIRDRRGGFLRALAIVEDISELRRSREELEHLVQERTAELHETVEELEAFSYGLTHDMRAPLRAMQTFATLAEEACAGCTRTQSMDYFRRIRVASHRLDQLIQDSLDYSKVLREELPLAPVEVSRLLRGIIETYPNLQPPAADIRLELGRLVVLGNESALTQVFANLLDNAVKFVARGRKPEVRIWAETYEVQSREGGDGCRVSGLEAGTNQLLCHSTLGARSLLPNAPPTPLNPQAPSGIQLPVSAPAPPEPLPTNSPPTRRAARIWVEDNGIGVPDHAHEKIFGMFQRMHHAGEYGGTGIGLTIVRKAVERMGGRVGLESEPGEGSRFWVELRLPAEPAAYFSI